jgi:hypothetical protein
MPNSKAPTMPVPYSLPTPTTMAAPELLLLGAALVSLAPLAPLVELDSLVVLEAALELLVVALSRTALAFLEPQVKDWQKAWPAASLGWAAVHSMTHCSHMRAGSVWP